MRYIGFNLKDKLFNQRKNKRFSYKPRLKNSKELDSKDELEAKWNEIRGNTKNKGSIFNSLPTLILILVSLFVLIYILNGYMK